MLTRLPTKSTSPANAGTTRSMAWFATASSFIALTGCGGDQRTAAAPSLLDSCPPMTAGTSAESGIAGIVDPLVAAEMEKQGLPSLTITIAKSGSVIYAHAYGYSDLSTCRLADLTTPYQIGSVTKQFTAAGILKLQEAGQLNIDAPLTQYLPSYGFDSRISIRMLLNQISGLDDYLSFARPANWVNGVDKSTVLSAIAGAKLLFPPGSAYAYSNSNYYVLGAVIEAVTGESYDSFINSQVWMPLGLLHTSYLEPQPSARPYSYDNPLAPGTQGLGVGIIPDSSVFFSAGALWSTTADLATWDAALFSGRILNPASLALMLTPPTVPDAQDPATNTAYAMGWVSTPTQNRPFFWHNGKTLAYTAFNGGFTDDGWSISILTNVDIQEGTPLAPFAYTIVSAVCSDPTVGGC